MSTGTPGASRSMQGTVPPPLTAEQLEEVRRAQARARAIARAVGVARTDGALMAVCAVLCFLTLCMGWENLAVGAALGGIAFNSFRGARRLQKFDRAGPKILAMNQLYLAGVITLYALFELWQVWHGSSALAAAIAGNSSIGKEVGGDMGREIDSLQRSMVMLVYGFYWALIVGTVVCQGLMALYYRSRRRYLDEYLERTPPWVIELERVRR